MIISRNLYHPALALILAVALPSTLALAKEGQGVGNGGGGFICPDPAQSELLDLFEAGIPLITADAPIKIVRSNAPVLDQVHQAISKLSFLRRSYKAILDTHNQVMNLKRIAIQPGTIAFPRDALQQVTKPGCTPMGLVLSLDSKDTLLWDETSVSKLPNTDQAALWVHESIYRYLRDVNGDNDSVRARKIVAHLFSDITQDELIQNVGYVLGRVVIRERYTDGSLPLPGSSGQVYIARDQLPYPLNPDETINLKEALRLPTLVSLPDLWSRHLIELPRQPGPSIIKMISRWVNIYDLGFFSSGSRYFFEHKVLLPSRTKARFEFQLNGAPAKYQLEFEQLVLSYDPRNPDGVILYFSAGAGGTSQYRLLLTIDSRYRLMEARYYKGPMDVLDPWDFLGKRPTLRATLRSGSDTAVELARAILAAIPQDQLEELKKHPTPRRSKQ